MDNDDNHCARYDDDLDNYFDDNDNDDFDFDNNNGSISYCRRICGLSRREMLGWFRPSVLLGQ